MAPALRVPKANVQEAPSELIFNALVPFLCPVRDFPCRYSTFAVGPACASTLQLRWLKFKTLPSVCHLIIGHLYGYMFTEFEVTWYCFHLSWKFPVGCFIANWRLLSADLLCSCLVYKVRELTWLKGNLLEELEINTSFCSATQSVCCGYTTASASTKKGQKLVAGSRWANRGPSL